MGTESIWMVEAAEYEVDDWNRPELHHHEACVDEGWFATKGAAQKACDGLNEIEKLRYADYVERVNQRNEASLARNKAKLSAWKVAVAVSDKPVSAPWLDAPERVETFDNWASRRYEVIEIESAET